MKKTINYIIGFLIVAIVSCGIVMFAIAYDKKSGSLPVEVESLTTYQQLIEGQQLIIDELNADNSSYFEVLNEVVGLFGEGFDVYVSEWGYGIIPGIIESIMSDMAYMQEHINEINEDYAVYFELLKEMRGYLWDAVILEIPDQTYTGDLITPVIDMSVGSFSFVENIDFTITYHNNVDIGIGEVVIIGAGEFVGMPLFKVHFSIVA